MVRDGERRAALGQPTLGDEPVDQGCEALRRQTERAPDLLARRAGAKRRATVRELADAHRMGRQRFERHARDIGVAQLDRNTAAFIAFIGDRRLLGLF